MLMALRLGFEKNFLWSERQQVFSKCEPYYLTLIIPTKNNLVAVQPQVIMKLRERFLEIHDGPKEEMLLIVYEFFALWQGRW